MYSSLTHTARMQSKNAIHHYEPQLACYMRIPMFLFFYWLFSQSSFNSSQQIHTLQCPIINNTVQSSILEYNTVKKKYIIHCNAFVWEECCWEVSKQKPLCIHQTQKWPISIINCQFSQSCNVQNNQPWAAFEKMFSTDLLSCVVSLWVSVDSKINCVYRFTDSQLFITEYQSM